MTVPGSDRYDRTEMRFLRAAFGLALVGVGFAACTGFEEAPSKPPVPEAGAFVPDAAQPVPDATPVVDAGVDADEEVPDATTTDACAICLSGHCQTDGGCDMLAFVTADKFPGDLGGDSGIARGDALCDQEANTVGRFRAWLSDPSSSAATRILAGSAVDRPIWRIDGAKIANSARALPQAKPLVGIARTFKNANVTVGDSTVWTGTLGNGGVSNHCSSWGTTNMANLGLYGNAMSMGPGWTESDTKPCNSTAHLYCFEVIP